MNDAQRFSVLSEASARLFATRMKEEEESTKRANIIWAKNKYTEVLKGLERIPLMLADKAYKRELIWDSTAGGRYHLVRFLREQGFTDVVLEMNEYGRYRLSFSWE